MPLSNDPDARARQLANLRQTPAPAGNTRALRHGGMARKATLVRAGTWAERVYAELEAEAPLRGADGGLPVHDRQVVELLASCLARLEAVQGWLEVRPALDEKGRPWPAEEVAGRLRREAAKHLDGLGMSPLARARLGLDLAQASRIADASTVLSAAAREPDPRLRERMLSRAGLIDDDDVEDEGDGHAR